MAVVPDGIMDLDESTVQFIEEINENVRMSDYWKTHLSNNDFFALHPFKLPKLFEFDFSPSIQAIGYLRSRGFRFDELDDNKYAKLLFRLFKDNISACDYLQALVKNNSVKFARFFMSRVITEFETIDAERCLFIINHIPLSGAMLLYFYDIPLELRCLLDSILLKTYVTIEFVKNNKQKAKVNYEPFLFFLSDEYKRCLQLLYPLRSFPLQHPRKIDFLHLLYTNGKRDEIYFELTFGKFFEQKLNQEHLDNFENDDENDGELQDLDTDLFLNLSLLDENEETF